MQLMLTLFSHWLQFSYSCFDRVILKGYLSVLSRPANIVYWIREVQGEPKVTKEFPLYEPPFTDINGGGPDAVFANVEALVSGPF